MALMSSPEPMPVEVMSALPLAAALEALDVDALLVGDTVLMASKVHLCLFNLSASSTET